MLNVVGEEDPVAAGHSQADEKECGRKPQTFDPTCIPNP